MTVSSIKMCRSSHLSRTASYADVQSSPPPSTRGLKLMGFIRSSLPKPYWWPTICIDLLANLHLLIVWCFFTIDSDGFKRRVRPNLFGSWHSIDYITHALETEYGVLLFTVWTLQTLVTVAIVHYHMKMPHHPKFYVGKANRVAIVCHIIGGTLASLGSWLGFVVGNSMLIKIASLAGLFLHVPSTFWQSRNLHGTREIVQPTYYFMNFLLIIKYCEVWFENGSYNSVLAMGLSVNIFALVRVYYSFIRSARMDINTSYDLAVLMAGISNVPLVMGSSACIQFVSSIILWNYYLNLLLPEYRSLMKVNRRMDIFQDTFLGRNVHLKEEMRKLLNTCNDRREVVARATFNIIAGDNNLIEMEELVDLFNGWGLVDSEKVAKQVFEDADANKDGKIDWEEFQEKFGFIFERVYAFGETEVADTGEVRVISAHNSKED
eukprot:CAMPEP_0183729180 /NCGR_PEP_ID=MMETSP0737-20130205/29879_1 /TAXON_ID=385413 /ORGANISM="Thalassiosira miniscula, Strain CCMP1093" /LENGTH=434 /DNA_ID=CAMNT_0025961315 /DNA_START=59 /DNA_END=1363 /DNA_ORIENTATION=+